MAKQGHVRHSAPRKAAPTAKPKITKRVAAKPKTFSANDFLQDFGVWVTFAFKIKLFAANFRTQFRFLQSTVGLGPTFLAPAQCAM